LQDCDIAGSVCIDIQGYVHKILAQVQGGNQGTRIAKEEAREPAVCGLHPDSIVDSWVPFRIICESSTAKYEKLQHSKKEKDKREAEDEMERAKQR
jgi:hypothetical protein